MAGHSKRLVSRILWFCLSFVAVILLQDLGNAFRSEFGGTLDEAAHYVTGLMVRDYLAAGFPGPALPYARDYYVHYPKVAFGHWPPLFYLIQAAWTLLFTASRTSVILLMAAITALLAAILCDSVRREFSLTLGAAAAALFISLPVIEEFSRLVMAEMLVALLVLLAVLAYGRYLDTGRWQSAFWFGIWFTLAMLTKGTAIQLAIVPPFAVLAGRHWQLLRRFSFWLPAILVLGLAGPWYKWVPGAQHEAVARFGGIHFYAENLTTTLATWAEMLGVVLLLAAGLGMLICSREGWRRQVLHLSSAGKWTASAGVILGAFIVRLFVGAFETRHLLVDIPELMLFASVFAAWLFRRPRWQALAMVPKTLIAGLALAALIGFNIRASPHKRHYGFSEVARDLLSRPQFKDSVFMVCSGAAGEGMLISEVAARESRPGHIVLRASKMLASIDWMGEDYRPLFHDSAAALQYLESIPAGIVVTDDSCRQTPHGQLLLHGLQSHPEKWQLLAHYPPGGANNPRIDDILIYRLIGHEGLPVGKIRIPMRSGLYGNFEN